MLYYFSRRPHRKTFATHGLGTHDLNFTGERSLPYLGFRPQLQVWNVCVLATLPPTHLSLMLVNVTVYHHRRPGPIYLFAELFSPHCSIYRCSLVPLIYSQIPLGIIDLLTESLTHHWSIPRFPCASLIYSQTPPGVWFNLFHRSTWGSWSLDRFPLA